MDILRVLGKDQYDAAMNAASPTAANPFATIADLGDSGIYGPSSSLTVDHTTTLGLFDWNIDIDVPLTGRLRIGRAGQTAIRPIHFFTPDTGPVRFSGFNSSNNIAAVEIGNTDHSIVSATFYNDGDVVLGDVGATAGSATTGRGRVTIGVTAPLVDYKLQIKGIDDGPGRGPLILYNDSGQVVAQFTNARTAGIGSLGLSTETFNVRSIGDTAGTWIAVFENLSGTPHHKFRSDGFTELGVQGGATRMGDATSSYLFQNAQSTTQFTNSGLWAGFHADRDGAGAGMLSSAAQASFVSTGVMTFGTDWNNNPSSPTFTLAMLINDSDQHVGINPASGAVNPASRLTVYSGDVETTGSANGYIFESPDTTRWQLKVDNFGSPTFVPLP